MTYDVPKGLASASWRIFESFFFELFVVYFKDLYRDDVPKL